MTDFQDTFAIIKPDAVERGLIGAILTRLEQAGFRIEELHMDVYGELAWRKHYAEHEGKPHFEALISHMADRPVVILQLFGVNAIARLRALIGTTNPYESPPGTIRGDLCGRTGVIADNLIHASATLQDARRELCLWFGVNGITDLLGELT